VQRLQARNPVNQKRVLLFGEWITEHILYPLPHRQYIFTIPGLLRPYFRFDRKLLGKLSQCAYQSLKEFFQTTLNRKEAMPGVVVSIQTFGDLVNFHPHLHCLVTDGCFMANGWFYVLPEIDVKKLESLFRHKVLKMLVAEKKIGSEVVEMFLTGKIPISASTTRSKSKAGTAAGGNAWPIYPALPVFSGQNDLPAAKQDGSLSL
jgi:Putative transposase